MKKHRIVAISAVALSAFALSACGSDKTQEVKDKRQIDLAHQRVGEILTRDNRVDFLDKKIPYRDDDYTYWRNGENIRPYFQIEVMTLNPERTELCVRYKVINEEGFISAPLGLPERTCINAKGLNFE